jgi:hypothetical protein
MSENDYCFEEGVKYKFMINKGFDKNSVYTIDFERETKNFIIGIDLENKRRGINKKFVLDWIEDNN